MPNELVIVLIAFLGAIVVQIPTIVSNIALWNKSNINARDIAANAKASQVKVEVDKSALDTNQNQYIMDQLKSVTSRLDAVQSQAHESAIRENAKDARIAALEATVQSKDEALAALREELAPIKAGIVLANQQLTVVQTKQSEASSDTQEQTDAMTSANRLKDYNSTQGVVHVVLPDDHPAPTGDTGPQSPVIGDGLHVQIVGTLSVPDDPPPTPAGEVAPDGSVRKVA